jgi:hypothetical protein
VATLDNFRFLRLFWEVRETEGSGPWCDYAKGGAFSPFYDDVFLIVNWKDDGREVKRYVEQVVGSVSRKIQAPDFYYRPGITWPSRTQKGFAPRALPARCIFDTKGNSAFLPNDNPEDILSTLAIFLSSPFRGLVSMQMSFGSYEVGVIQRTPLPITPEHTRRTLSDLARTGWRAKRALDSGNMVSHAHVLPALLQTSGLTLCDRAAAWQTKLDDADRELAAVQAEIDEIVFELYGLEEEDRQAILESLGESSSTGDEDAEDEEAEESVVDAKALVVDLLSYAVGAAFGRFDVRCATGEFEAPELPDPFAPLPACSPGMLTGEDGLPLSAEPAGYPLRISWDGVLVDDPGLAGGAAHTDDIVSRVRELLTLLWGERAEDIEHEACDLLGTKTLRDFFRKPSGFFAEHLKRYSKSRRQAPIYWPLSTALGSRTLWLYYPRLDEDLLYTAVNRYLEPKMGAVGRRLSELDTVLPTASGREATELRKEHEELGALQTELADLRAEIMRVAALPYKPDLDDGVLICAAPLAKLSRLTKWRRDLEACWKKLEGGDYDWAHLANAIWPGRVLEACRRDRSIAIAHGVEEEYEE